LSGYSKKLATDCWHVNPRKIKNMDVTIKEICAVAKTFSGLSFLEKLKNAVSMPYIRITATKATKL